MTKKELYHYLQEPETLSRESIATLKQLVNAYPYAGGLVFLYLYSLQHARDIRFSLELQRLAIRLPNRSLLYALAEQKAPYRSITLPKEGEKEGFSLVEQFLEEQCYPGEQSFPSSQEIAISEDYFASIGVTEDYAPLNTHEKLPSRSYTNKEDEIGDKEEAPENGTKKAYLGDTLFTETLGRIYAKQKRYDKALSVFEAIAAKNSEKSIYFVEQIEYLQLLTENKQEEQSQ